MKHDIPKCTIIVCEPHEIDLGFTPNPEKFVGQAIMRILLKRRGDKKQIIVTASKEDLGFFEKTLNIVLSKIEKAT